MSKEPYGIRRYKERSDQQMRGDESLRQATILNAATMWYEKANRQLPNPKDLDRAAEVMEKDFKLAAEQLVTARRERLRDLYAAEMAGWQAELAAKGLAIERRTD